MLTCGPVFVLKGRCWLYECGLASMQQESGARPLLPGQQGTCIFTRVSSVCRSGIAKWNGQAACHTNSYVCCSLAAHAKGLLKFSMQQKFTLQSCALQREALA